MGSRAEWECKTFLFRKNLSLGLTPAETAGGDVLLSPDTPQRKRCLGEGLADHSMNVPTEDLPPPVYLAISELIHLRNAHPRWQNQMPICPSFKHKNQQAQFV